MAITIRNKETEAKIRHLGKRWKLGPSAVVKRLADKEVSEDGQISDHEHERLMARFEDLARTHPPPSPRISWPEAEAEMQALFDYMDEDTGNSRVE